MISNPQERVAPDINRHRHGITFLGYFLGFKIQINISFPEIFSSEMPHWLGKYPPFETRNFVNNKNSCLEILIVFFINWHPVSLISVLWMWILSYQQRKFQIKIFRVNLIKTFPLLWSTTVLKHCVLWKSSNQMSLILVNIYCRFWFFNSRVITRGFLSDNL